MFNFKSFSDRVSETKASIEAGRDVSWRAGLETRYVAYLLGIERNRKRAAEIHLTWTTDTAPGVNIDSLHAHASREIAAADARIAQLEKHGCGVIRDPASVEAQMRVTAENVQGQGR